MSEETKKVEKKAEQTEQEKATELSDKDLDNVAGGAVNLNASRSNVY